MDKQTEKTLMSIKRDLLQYIDEHAHLPNHLKSEAKAIASDHMNALSRFLGTMELAWRRGLHQGKEDTEDKGWEDQREAMFNAWERKTKKG